MFDKWSDECTVCVSFKKLLKNNKIGCEEFEFMLNVLCVFRPKCLSMCNVPPKFYQLCRLCLSIDKENALSIFDKTAVERNIPRKIMTCLSILVR